MSNTNDFRIENNTLERYLGNDAHVVVPDGVTVIDSYAFRRLRTVRSVQLPDSVTKICDNAFQGCTSLEQVNIPPKVKSIGAEAFRNCRQLGQISFSAEPGKIGTLAFFGCWKLAREGQNLIPALQEFFDRMKTGALTLEEGKKLYDYSKSKGAATIKGFDNVSMQAWDGTKYPYAFSNSENSLILPVSIGELPVVKVPSKQLPEDGLVYCGAEQFDKLPRPNKAILAVHWLMEDKMLREDLAEKIPVFIKKYSADVVYALKDCDKPAAYQRFLEIAKPKQDLMDQLVEQCAGKAEIQAVLLNFSSASGKSAPSLTLDAKPKTAAELKKLWTYQNLLISETGEKVIVLTNYKGHDKRVEIPAYIGKTRVGSVQGTFPAEVETVEFPSADMEINCSFRNCKAMVDSEGFITVNVGNRCVLTDYVGAKDVDVLTIPDRVTENSYGTFRGLEIRKAIFPEGFVSLAGASFMECRRLQLVQLPESLRSIGQMAFQKCSALEQLYIPGGVTEIGVLDLNRANDAALRIYGTQGSAAWEYAQKYGLPFAEGKPMENPMPDFLVKKGVLLGYVGKDGDLEISAEVEEIGSFALRENKAVRTLVIGNRVRVIHDYAFVSCSNLTSVKIGGQVKEIGNCAFQFTGLTQAELEEGVESIGESAFNYLSACGATIRIPRSVVRIGENAFGGGIGKSTLIVKAGSFAETYAKENNIPFVAE